MEVSKRGYGSYVTVLKLFRLTKFLPKISNSARVAAAGVSTAGVSNPSHLAAAEVSASDCAARLSERLINLLASGATTGS